MIYLLRHGDAEDGEGKPDEERELTEKGRRQADAAGRALATLGVDLEACLTSPKARARDTAAIACRHLGLDPEETRGLAGGMIDAPALAAGRGDVLLVGHEPDFSDQIAHLTGGQVKLKKGGLAALDGRVLHLLLRPKDLQKLAD